MYCVTRGKFTMAKYSLQNKLQCTVLPTKTSWLNYTYSLQNELQFIALQGHFIIAKYSQQNELECIVLPGETSLWLNAPYKMSYNVLC